MRVNRNDPVSDSVQTPSGSYAAVSKTTVRLSLAAQFTAAYIAAQGSKVIEIGKLMEINKSSLAAADDLVKQHNMEGV